MIDLSSTKTSKWPSGTTVAAVAVENAAFLYFKTVLRPWVVVVPDGVAAKIAVVRAFWAWVVGEELTLVVVEPKLSFFVVVSLRLDVVVVVGCFLSFLMVVVVVAVDCCFTDDFLLARP